MIEIMRNAAPKRLGRPNKITRDFILSVVRAMPSKRNGRLAYIKARCKEINVSDQGFYKAHRNMFGKSGGY